MDAPERIWADTEGGWMPHDASELRYDHCAEYIRADLHQATLAIPNPTPADLLADAMRLPEIRRLVESVQALGAMPEGYCFCSSNRIGSDSKIHEPECRDLRAAIAEFGK